MRNKLFFLPVLLAGILFLGSCKPNVLKGEGPKSTTTRDVAAFSAVKVEFSLKANITLKEGAPSVQLSGYDNIIKHLKTTVENNTLRIYSDLDDTWELESDDDDTDSDITAIITVPSLTGLTLSGSPDADIHGSLGGNNFDLNISGSATVVIDNLNVNDFSSHVSGSAEIDVNGGSVKNATYNLSGAGEINAYPLQTLATTVKISGAGDAEVTASQNLTAHISGAGNVSYKGHPVVSQQISGVGKVSDAN